MTPVSSAASPTKVVFGIEYRIPAGYVRSTRMRQFFLADVIDTVGETSTR